MEPPASNNVGNNLHAAQSAFSLSQAPQTGNDQALPVAPSSQVGQQPNDISPVHIPQLQQAAPSATSTPSQDEAAIEQQWIQKAKQIISKTRDDPFNQSRLLIELKLHYLAARYGKQAEDSKHKP